ncbi:hypothetical protein JHK82_015971 [Glycine max]|uniref:Uncharacterized protein n=2 Tax=Glycine subgen. Soja TaxID=1462606 RepID=A0A0R0JKC2_SOYBN|nr:hypothetical protein JHK87_015917 [Glycine soja]KAG5032385.1 hypothetical protein JHK85_016367 [Glycine max]KAG5046589.1 hypothetical protein JHK86_015995 [Glycine max]KAG5149090.1 hypothetical protein JHK82_015971 [Glycine max]KAH1126993.1 hypothetical protein GYH30_015822 [Glycine max]
MAFISMAINLIDCMTHACGNKDNDWYLYAPTACTEGDDPNGDVDSWFAYMEGDDDDGYDYAPAA